ncbi:hypothetical protein B0T18DRAFT_429054 [Schizothecium vesticola]|uniref:Zn(2)-C6 fungal-type domain-containing protein n=1 Tax=Schizothecium vesticola TaxID=314040 RepID=A0AA40EUZ9_9PEZI|nr:hypothetical protein B0T18DRAFT_429054 [Schizothecium vesticola]
MSIPMPTDLRRNSVPSHGLVPTIENPLDQGGQASTPSPGNTAGPPNNDYNTIDQTAASGLAAPKPIRRRMRMITSCLECRRRKLKCNKMAPCLNCQKFTRDCTYIGPKLDEASQLKLTEMKEKVGSLERHFEQVVVKSATRAGSHELGPGAGGGRGNTIIADDINDELEDEGDLEPTPMIAADLTYEDDADGPEDIMDLGIRIGKMRITEKIGGMNRPRLSEEILVGLNNSGQGDTVQMILQQQSILSGMGSIDPATGQLSSIPEFLRPSDSYIAPSSGFFFGHILQTPPILSLLPSEAIRSKLMNRYFEAVHPVAPCGHRPSLEALFRSFEEDIRYNIEPRASVQAVVFAAWFSATLSLPAEDVPMSYGVNRDDLLNKMKLGAESAMSKAHFIRTTKVETLQALVMYLIALCRNEVSRAHSILTGAAIRIAQCMGLNRDGELYGLTPLETHVRRLIWHQLCFLDIRTCEAQGPNPSIRREEYDAKLPLNIDDEDLAPTTRGPLAMSDHFTLMLLPRIRFEINEMMRILWSDRRKLESRRIALHTVLNKIESFRKSLFEQYYHMLDDSTPLRRYVKQVMMLLLYRLNVMVLHPYHANAAHPMPEKLSTLLVYCGISMIENSIALERNPLYRDWRWYLGAYHQYQIALLLATEIYYTPAHPLAHRIWACLDDVFGLDPNLPREEKAVKVLTEIMSKTGLYTSMRKVRAPAANADAVLDRQPAVKTSSPPASHAEQKQKAEGLAGGGYPTGAAGMVLPNSSQAQPSYLPPPPHISQQPLPPAPPTYSIPILPPGMVFGGVSNGETLWALPGNFPNSPDHTSDEESPRACGMQQQQQQQQQQQNQQQQHQQHQNQQHHHQQQQNQGMGGVSGVGHQGLAHLGPPPAHQHHGQQAMEIDWGQMELLAQEYNFNAMVDENAGGLGGFTW